MVVVVVGDMTSHLAKNMGVITSFVTRLRKNTIFFLSLVMVDGLSPRSLADSMPARLMAVLDKNGDPFRYKQDQRSKAPPLFKG